MKAFSYKMKDIDLIRRSLLDSVKEDFNDDEDLLDHDHADGAYSYD